MLVLTEMDRAYEQLRAAIVASSQNREPFRDISVKVHIRRPERDTWAYMGRGIVTQEIMGQSSRISMFHSNQGPHARVSQHHFPRSRKISVFAQDSYHVRRGMSLFTRLVSMTNLCSQPQGAALQAERRGNFVVIGCVEGNRVVSWSLNVRTPVPTSVAEELTLRRPASLAQWRLRT